MLPDPTSFHAMADQWQQAATSTSQLIAHSQATLAALPQKAFSFPFEQMSENLFDSLDIGRAIGRSAGTTIPESTISIVLDTLGRDILLFLSASVVVTLLSKAVNVTPILGYLVAGAVLGPHRLDIFANTVFHSH